jgi:UDP-glucose 4-epimerase
VRVVVLGATGNVGSSLVSLLSADPGVDSVVGVARRKPELDLPKIEWATADIRTDDLVPLLDGADAVVHLAWLIQPSRDEAVLRSVNVDGSRRVFDAVASAGVRSLVYASSIGTYSPGPKHEYVDESWPATGIASSFYARHKAEVERMLDAFEASHPDVRVARLRPTLIFKRSAASGIRRLFAGPFLPGSLLRPSLIPILPLPRGLRFQAVHTDDVADAYRRAILRDAAGSFNIAADDVIDGDVLARILHARTFELSPRATRVVLDAAWHARLQPTPPGWLDMALAVPLISSARAKAELEWIPQRTGVEALEDLLDGLRAGAGEETPPLARSTGGRARWRELATGIGARLH